MCVSVCRGVSLFLGVSVKAPFVLYDIASLSTTVSLGWPPGRET